jgi:hypothetical protein
MFRPRVLVAGLTVALALTACGGPAPGPTSDPDPEETVAVPTPTPTPTESGELFLAPDGVGSLRLGEPVGADDTFMAFDPVGCADLGIPEGDPYAGYWKSTLPEFIGEDGYPLEVFFAMTDNGLEGGDVTSVSVFGDLRTEAGIGIGDTRDAVMAAYPDGFDDVIAGFGSDVYVIEGDVGRLSIEVTRAPEGDPYWEPDQLDKVLILSSTTGPAGPRAGTDGGGPCPL